MSVSPSSVYMVVPNTDGKAVTGYASLVDADGVDLPAVSFAQAEAVADSLTDTVAHVAATVNAILASLRAAGQMAES